MFKFLTDTYQGKNVTASLELVARSPQWPSVRADHLKAYPFCLLCGGKTTLEVHHIVPFHVEPRLELNPDNLITLCEAKRFGLNCHLAYGHLGNYKRYNLDVRTDVATWSAKLRGNV